VPRLIIFFSPAALDELTNLSLPFVEERLVAGGDNEDSLIATIKVAITVVISHGAQDGICHGKGYKRLSHADLIGQNLNLVSSVRIIVEKAIKEGFNRSGLPRCIPRIFHSCLVLAQIEIVRKIDQWSPSRKMRQQGVKVFFKTRLLAQDIRVVGYHLIDQRLNPSDCFLQMLIPGIISREI